MLIFTGADTPIYNHSITLSTWKVLLLTHPHPLMYICMFILMLNSLLALVMGKEEGHELSSRQGNMTLFFPIDPSF